MPTFNGRQPVSLSPYLRLVATENRKDVANNRTQLRVRAYLIVPRETIAIGYTLNQLGALTVNGQTTSFRANGGYVSSIGSYLLKDHYQWIPHNSDGTKTVSVSGYYDIGITWNGQYISRISASGSMTLGSIPRGSDIRSASLQYHLNPGVENYLNIDLNVKLSGANHHVAIYDRAGNAFIGEWRETNPKRLTLNTTHVDRMLNRMPNQEHKNDFYVAVTTYQNEKLIERKERNLSATVNSVETKPIIEDYTVWLQGSGYDKRLNEYIQNVSKVHTKFKSRTRAGASIASRKITIQNGGEVFSGGWGEGDYFYHDSETLTKSGTYTITYEAVDSRGFKTTQTRTFNVTAYQPPKIESFWAYRQNGRLNLTFRRTFSSLGNRNSLGITIRAKPKNGYQSTIYSTTTYTESQTQTATHNGASETQAYDYTLTLTDQFGNKVEAVTNIGTGHVLMAHWEDKATGFGMFPSKKGISVKDNIYMTEAEIPLIEQRTNSNGNWAKFYNGLLICWGTTTATYKGSTWIGVNVTFPHSFVNSSYTINLTRKYTTSFYSKTTVFYENKTERGFTINVRVVDGTGANVVSGYNTEVDWLAIGRWKY